MSPGWRSETGLMMFQIPVKSGLPSAVRGAWAVRFGLPSAVRGMPGVRRSNHCASSGVAKALKRIIVVKIFIGLNTSRRRLLYASGGRDGMAAQDGPNAFGMSQLWRFLRKLIEEFEEF